MKEGVALLLLVILMVSTITVVRHLPAGLFRPHHGLRHALGL